MCLLMFWYPIQQGHCSDLFVIVISMFNGSKPFYTDTVQAQNLHLNKWLNDQIAAKNLDRLVHRMLVNLRIIHCSLIHYSLHSM